MYLIILEHKCNHKKCIRKKYMNIDMGLIGKEKSLVIEKVLDIIDIHPSLTLKLML